MQGKQKGREQVRRWAQEGAEYSVNNDQENHCQLLSMSNHHLPLTEV